MNRSEFNILIIDDDEIARDVIVSLLSKEGFSVKSAKDGIEGIATLKMNRFDLVITDLKMPGADGIEVLKEAKRIDPKTSVVILTAYGTLDNALEAIRLGAFDYITKPFKLQELLFVVENAMKTAELVRENEELRSMLRMTVADLEVINNRDDTFRPEITVNMLERIARLRDLGVLTNEEVEVLKERLLRSGRNAEGIGSR
ncbi:MAG: response regulator [Nitrospirae bacterium]|nr:MAG: response regulator [Nitrospirota bacterium]